MPSKFEIGRVVKRVLDDLRTSFPETKVSGEILRTVLERGAAKAGRRAAPALKAGDVLLTPKEMMGLWLAAEAYSDAEGGEAERDAFRRELARYEKALKPEQEPKPEDLGSGWSRRRPARESRATGRWCWALLGLFVLLLVSVLFLARRSPTGGGGHETEAETPETLKLHQDNPRDDFVERRKAVIEIVRKNPGNEAAVLELWELNRRLGGTSK